MSKFELIKKLESMIAFQADCLATGNWDAFDKAEDVVKNLEKSILEENWETAANLTGVKNIANINPQPRKPDSPFAPLIGDKRTKNPQGKAFFSGFFDACPSVSDGYEHQSRRSQA